MKRLIRSSEEILGMSIPKKDVAASLEQITRKLMEHLIKLYMYPDVWHASHWRQEVHTLLHQVSRFKGSKKFPSSKFILDNTININKDLIKVMYEDIEADYSDENGASRRVYSKELVYVVYEYFEWVAKELSSRGQVFRKAVYAKLEELGLGRD